MLRMHSFYGLLPGLALGLILAACAGRGRQPIIQQPPAQTSTASGTKGGVLGPQDGKEPNGNVVTKSETITDTGTGTGGTTPNTSGGNTGTSSTTTTATGTDSSIVIVSTNTDGTQTSVEWDGKSFKGNEKYDVIRVAP